MADDTKKFDETVINIENTTVPEEIERLDSIFTETAVQKTNQVWNDGKPVFREVLDFGSLPNAVATSQDLTTAVGDVDQIVDLRVIYNSGTSTGQIARVHNWSDWNGSNSDYLNWWFEYNSPNNKIHCDTAFNWSSYSAIVVVEFTKK